MASRSTRRPVRVVASPTIADWWLPAALVALEGRHERHLSVEVITANSSLVRDMVRTAAATSGWRRSIPASRPRACPRPSSGATKWSSPSRRTHRWAVGGDIDSYEFASTPIIRRDPGANSTRVVEAVLGLAGLSPVTPLAEIGNNVAARATALAENAPVLLPFAELMDEPDGGLVVKRVAGMRFEREFALILAGSLQDLAAPARALAQHLLGWQRRARARRIEWQSAGPRRRRTIRLGRARGSAHLGSAVMRSFDDDRERRGPGRRHHEGSCQVPGIASSGSSEW